MYKIFSEFRLKTRKILVVTCIWYRIEIYENRFEQCQYIFIYEKKRLAFKKTNRGLESTIHKKYRQTKRRGNESYQLVGSAILTVSSLCEWQVSQNFITMLFPLSPCLQSSYIRSTSRPLQRSSIAQRWQQAPKPDSQ